MASVGNYSLACIYVQCRFPVFDLCTLRLSVGIDFLQIRLEQFQLNRRYEAYFLSISTCDLIWLDSHGGLVGAEGFWLCVNLEIKFEQLSIDRLKLTQMFVSAMQLLLCLVGS